MRWLTILVLWVVALVVALVVLRRVRRGKPVVLAGRWSPVVVRMVAVILVVLGAGEESPESIAAPKEVPVRGPDDQLPRELLPYLVQHWLSLHQQDGPFQSQTKLLVRALAGDKLTDKELASAMDDARRLGEPMHAMIRADLAAVKEGKPAPAVADRDLLKALTLLETNARYDHFWNAYLWRKTAAGPTDPAVRSELYARFRRHARITDALIKAHARVRPMMEYPRAWMSKAGPGPAEQKAIQAHAAKLQDMIKVANEVLPRTDEGTWKRDGVALLKPVAGLPIPMLVRAGKDRPMSAEDSTRFGRLDLLKSGDQPTAVVHDWLGRVDLPAKATVSVWDLPKYLPDAAKQKLDVTVLVALKENSEEAADRLERSLAVAHAAIRAGLKELPKAPGAPRLRLILSLFDDTPMPALPN
ncbi:MAG TPA: hypothetical protein VM597_24390, partial [Gemmataceae bacterium]|nr:hypothetical protein [Gemmataceae bacterium]